MKKLLALLIICTLCVSLTNTKQAIEINIWNKVSTDDLNPGEIVALDMTKGYSFSDYQYIYLVVQAVGSEEEIVVAFPNGGYWTAPKPDPFLQELQKEFDSLEDYLRNQKSEEIKKK